MADLTLCEIGMESPLPGAPGVSRATNVHGVLAYDTKVPVEAIERYVSHHPGATGTTR